MGEWGRGERGCSILWSLCSLRITIPFKHIAHQIIRCFVFNPRESEIKIEITYLTSHTSLEIAKRSTLLMKGTEGTVEFWMHNHGRI